LIERRVIAGLRPRVFHSVAELKAAIGAILHRLNDERPIRRLLRTESRNKERVSIMLKETARQDAIRAILAPISRVGDVAQCQFIILEICRSSL
jgi:hypothetical protein